MGLGHRRYGRHVDLGLLAGITLLPPLRTFREELGDAAVGVEELAPEHQHHDDSDCPDQHNFHGREGGKLDYAGVVQERRAFELPEWPHYRVRKVEDAAGQAANVVLVRQLDEDTSHKQAF